MNTRLRPASFLVMISGWSACLVTALAWTASGPSLEPVPTLLAPAECAGDVTGDLVVDFKDLLVVLSEWGPCALCPPGLTNCGGVCVDLLNDSNNCGACGNVCPPVSACFQAFCEGP